VDREEGAVAATCGTREDAAAACRSGGGVEDEGNAEEAEAFLVPPVDAHLSVGNVRRIT
jgi:hypothetical protein